MQALFVVATLLAAPGWVTNGGNCARYPRSRYLVGFSMQSGPDAAKRAAAAAAADLARQVEVRIESDARDISVEANGKEAYAVAAYTRASTDVRLQGMHFETHRDGAKAFALAVLDRQIAATKRAEQRDAANDTLRSCVAAADGQYAKRKLTLAATTYVRCGAHVATVLRELAVASALGAPTPPDLAAKVAAADNHVRERLEDIKGASVHTSFDDAIAFIAWQLHQQGLGNGARLEVAPLTYANTEFSSSFGRAASEQIERAVAKRRGSASGTLVGRGVYIDDEDVVRLRLTIARAGDGSAVGAAEARLAKAAIPRRLELVPRNYRQALEDQRLLGKGELLGGGLRLEVWTNKGRRNLVFEEGEDVRLYIRVNQPAYVRLVYVLQTGHKVPLEQSYFIDASKVNLAVEYPDTFVVSPPFGVEQVYAAAFTKKPAPLRLARAQIDGEAYQVVADGTAALVEHRGLKRKSKTDQAAEATLSLTTTPRRRPRR